MAAGAGWCSVSEGTRETWQWQCAECGTRARTERPPGAAAPLPDGWTELDALELLCKACSQRQLTLFGART